MLRIEPDGLIGPGMPKPHPALKKPMLNIAKRKVVIKKQYECKRVALEGTFT